MSKLFRSLTRLLRREDGPTAVEYAFMAFLIIVVCMIAIMALGKNTNAMHSHNASKITGSQ